MVDERPRPQRRSTRRRRLWTRAAPLGAVAVLRSRRSVTRDRAGRAERHLVQQYVRAGRRPTREDVFAARLRLAGGDVEDAVRSHRPSGRRDRNAALDRSGPRRQPRGDEIPVQVRVHAGVRNAERDAPRAARRQRLGRERQVLRRARVPGTRARRAAHTPGDAVVPGRSARQRRHAARPGSRPHQPDSGCRQPDRRHARPDPPGEARAYSALGYPADAKVGLTGLERVFQNRLAGKPGGTLLAGTRPLARSTPVAGRTVTTTINPTIERAALTAMAGRYAGIAAMDPRTGGLLALAGVAFSALQPPGSTMKIITATGALEAGIVKLTDTFPIQDSANVGGFILHNAGGEFCGGTFLNAFAVSCNSVFAPLGAKLGAKKLVEHRRALRLQPVAVDPRCRHQRDPLRCDDRRRHRCRLLGDRTGKGAEHRARDGRCRRHDRDGRPAADPDAAGARATALRPRHESPRRAAGAADDDGGRASTGPAPRRRSPG